SLDWKAPNEDGTLLAFGLSKAGDENSILYVMDVDSREWLADEIPGKVGGVDWLNGSDGFFYRCLEDVKNPYSAQIKYHKLGTHHRQDKLIFEQYKEGPLATTWGPSANFSRDGRWMVLSYWTGTDSNDLWVVDMDKWFRTGELVKTDLIVGEKCKSYGIFSGDHYLLHTTYQAPNARVVKVNLHQPGVEHWKEIIPERKDAVLDDISLARGMVIGDYLKDAQSLFEKFDLDGNSLGEIPLPGIGSAGVVTHDDRTEGFLAFSSFNEPLSIYHIDLETNKRELWERPDVPVDPSIVEVKQVFVTSKDGTTFPMFIVHKKGLELNGKNPTILNGYGGFDISLTPYFSATLFPWYEAGGVYVSANLRGGGEYGEKWHQAGMLENKQNVFDDFIAAAEWLIENKYTDSQHLGISGGSNGGLLVGAAITQRPDLFAAAISGVPLLDMLRYQHFLMAKYWVPEYGDSAVKEQYEFLKKYSPYQNVKEGTAYPATLVTAGENDTRVHALHAMKMVPLLRDSTTSDPVKDPILLWVDRSAGHGGGKPLDLRIRDVVDQRIFMMWQLGMLEGAK
ncbi:MAG: S9 family peptidase, partial [Candidatus Omnitrophica bacterium]|nr:S9 family peptidase [Candidatus Omnitrophota bacterium]